MLKKIYKSLPKTYKEVKKISLNFELLEDEQV